jgi:murein DD-endopeptidase MepM/ murein hydrolase activator NlpD
MAALTCVFALTAALMPPAGAADSLSELSDRKSETEAQLGNVEDRIDQAQQGLEDLEQRQSATVAQLDQINKVRAELQADLAELNNELDGAQTALDEAESALAKTTEQVKETKKRLARTRNKLERRRDRFADRARAAYMAGGTSYAETVIDVSNVSELTDTLAYTTSVMDEDRQQVERIEDLETHVEGQAEKLEALKERQTEQRKAAESERDRVAGLVERQQRLTAKMTDKQKRHEELLAQIKANKASHEALLAALEEDSSSLESELRAIAEEQEARREARAEARRRARERRRRERAEARRRAQRLQEQRAARAEAEEQASGERLADAERSEDLEGSGDGGFVWPVDAPITSSFGYRDHPIAGTTRLHSGTDFGAPTGTAIRAAADGIVVSAGLRGGYGNAVVIDHGDGLATMYAHQSAVAVSAGDQVEAGETVGFVGSTGYSTGPHLHFEVRIDGAPTEPLDWL